MIHVDPVVSNSLVFQEKRLDLFLNTDQTTRDRTLQRGSYSLLTNYKKTNYVFTNPPGR